MQAKAKTKNQAHQVSVRQPKVQKQLRWQNSEWHYLWTSGQQVSNNIDKLTSSRLITEELMIERPTLV